MARPPLLLLATLLAAAANAADLFTLSPANFREAAPAGKEADAILGDYILRNDRITAAVADPRLMMGRSASRWAIPNVAGALLDLSLRNSSNDLLTAFYPAAPRFKPDAPNYAHEFTDETKAHLLPGREPVTAKRVVLSLPAYELESGKRIEELEALPVHLRASPKPRVEVRYILEDGWDFLRVETEYVNPTDHPALITPFMALRVDDAANFSFAFQNRLLLVVDPGWKGYYGVAAEGHTFQARTPRAVSSLFEDNKPSFTLPPGGRRTVAQTVFPGYSYHHLMTVAAGLLGEPVPPEPMIEVAATDEGTVTVEAADEAGRPLPVRIVYHGRDGTPDPVFFPATGEERVRNAIHTHTGRSSERLPSGRYDLTVSAGPEYHAFTGTLTVANGGRETIRARLERAFETPGWIAADLHNHTTLSGASEIFYVYPYSKDPTADGDSTASPKGRILSLLASGIEFAPATEHNFSHSYGPLIRELGMEGRLATCPGIGLTAGRRHTVTHQNVFPAPHSPGRQDGGVPQRPEHVGQLEWMLKWTNAPEKLVQIVMTRNDPLHPAAGMDVLDVIDLEPLVQGKPIEGRDNRILDWIALLNQGYRLPAVVNGGAFDNYARAGAVRNYVRVPVDDPARLAPLEVVRAAKKGRVLMTTGPFLEVALETPDDSFGPGDSVALKGSKARLTVRLKAGNTGRPDRVRVLVNGAPDPTLTFPCDFGNGTGFERTLELTLTNDCHLIVIADGKGPDLLSPSPSPRPVRVHAAVSNPIWIDAGADGYRPRSPLDDTVTTRLDFVIPPLVREQAEKPGRIRLELDNTGSDPASGVCRLDLVPAGVARLESPAEQPYTLAPGGKTALEWELRLEDAFVATGFPVRSDYNNTARFGIRVPRGPGESRHRSASLHFQADHPLASLPPVASPDAAETLLRNERPYPVFDGERRELAQCRWGVSGSNLVFRGFVHDPQPARRPLQWEGSCIELFGSMPGRSSQNKPSGGYFPIRQVYLLPPSEGKPAEAFKRVEDRVIAAPEIRLWTAPADGGYDVWALIPLHLLGTDPDLILRNVFTASGYHPAYLLDLDPFAGRLLLEARVTAPRPAPLPPRRGTAFGSRAPHADHNAFGRMRLMGPVRAEIEPLGSLSAAPGAPPARVRVSLLNTGTSRVGDVITLLAEQPEGLRFLAPPEWTFSLEAGAATSRVFELSMPAPVQRGWIDLTLPRSPNGAVAGTPSIRLPVVDHPLSSLRRDNTKDASAVREALLNEPERTITVEGAPAVRFRTALLNGQLAFHASVTGDNGRPAEPPWKGSCLEVFAASHDLSPIGHVFLVPAAEGKPAAGLVADDDPPAPDPAIQVWSSPSPTGYQLTALIPLARLKLPPEPERLKLEFQVSLNTGADRLLYGTAFGSTRAYMTPLAYGSFFTTRQGQP